MKKKGKAIAARHAAMASRNALSWQAVRSFFTTIRGAQQIHAGHLQHLHDRARMLAGQIADAEARALLCEAADDLAQVLALARQASDRRRT